MKIDRFDVVFFVGLIAYIVGAYLAAGDGGVLFAIGALCVLVGALGAARRG